MKPQALIVNNGRTGEERPPDYERVVRVLSDADLEDEILAGRGTDEYRAALVSEHGRRAGTSKAAAPERVECGRPRDPRTPHAIVGCPHGCVTECAVVDVGGAT